MYVTANINSTSACGYHTEVVDTNVVGQFNPLCAIERSAIGNLNVLSNGTKSDSLYGAAIKHGHVVRPP